MIAATRRNFDQVLWRMHGRWLLVLLIALLSPQLCGALQARVVSPSVVLVLKLVSTTHVKPTTGVVISDDGLVLVSADFVSLEGEIIVLDGGTDIVKHGRPARVVNQSKSGELAVLSVIGLSRPGIILSENAPDLEQEFHLTAFPPAEFIAKGAPPLWAPVKIIQGDPDKQFSISPSTPQPYVSGPIIDTCGYLAGLNLTSGPQSLQPGKMPLTIFTDELKRSLDSMQIKTSIASCDYKIQPAVQSQDTGQSAGLKSRALESEKSVLQGKDPDLIRPNIYSPFIPRKRLNPFQGASIPAQQPENTIKPSIWRSTPLWLLMLGFVALATLTWKGFFYFRLRKDDIRRIPATRSVFLGQPASDEPDTAPLQAASDTSGGKPRSAPQDEAEMPDMNTLPEGCNGVLVVEGVIDTDTRFKRYYIVNTQQVNVVIGRGDTDISIKHPAISRHHARLEYNGEFMTLSDLGSSHGTYIKGTPCLQGEVMYIEAGDEIFLGDVQLRISIIKKEVKLP